jgi:hypothetical protein
MSRRVGQGILLTSLLTWLAFSRIAAGGDYVATTNGNWNDTAIWTAFNGTPIGNHVPGNGDRAYIGLSNSAGAQTASITLTANQSVTSVTLGGGTGASGTLDLGDSSLNIGDSLYIGSNGGTGSIIRGTGSFTALTTYVNESRLQFGVNDSTLTLRLSNGATATTAATSNFHQANVDASTLNLGANTQSSAHLSVSNGGVLNANGHDINAGTFDLGSNTGSGGDWTLSDWGRITASSLNVYGGSLGFHDADSAQILRLFAGASSAINNASVQQLFLSNGSHATTSNVGNIKSTAVVNASTLDLSAKLSLTGALNISNGGILNAHAHDITAATLNLGSGRGGDWTLKDQGRITAGSLNILGSSLAFHTADSISNLNMTVGATATTAGVGNIATTARVDGSTLNLGAQLSLSSLLTVSNGGILNANGHGINASNITLGSSGSGGDWTLKDQGQITAGSLNIFGGSLGFHTGDSINNLYLWKGATSALGGSTVQHLYLYDSSRATTSDVGNITTTANVDGSTLELGANLSLSGSLTVSNGGVLNANGHDIHTAQGITLSGDGTSITNDGAITAFGLQLGTGNTETFHGGNDTITSILRLNNSSILTVVQDPGVVTGLTFGGAYASDLVISSSAILDLRFASALKPGLSWAFRWRDPSPFSDWVGTLEALIATGRIDVEAPHGYRIFDLDGYTYIGLQIVPEPSSFALLGLGFVAACGAARRRAS